MHKGFPPLRGERKYLDGPTCHCVAASSIGIDILDGGSLEGLQIYWERSCSVSRILRTQLAIFIIPHGVQLPLV